MQTSPKASLRRLPCALRPGPVSLLLLFAATLALIPSKAQAGANRIYDQGAAATGQSAAFVAQADDPSAIYYNPAGMTQLRGVQTYTGVLLAGGSTDFSNAGASATGNFDGSVLYPPPLNLYITANLKDLGVTQLGDLSVGIGVLSPFGTLYRWPNNGPFATARTFAALELIDFKPTLAYKLNDQLSVGLGADVYTFADFWGEGQTEDQLIAAGPLPPPPVISPGDQLEVNGKGTAVGFNVSLLYTPFRNDAGKPLANVGLIYRSQAVLKLDGQLLVNGAVGADASTTLVIPQIITGGIALWPIRDQDNELKLELDVDYTGWKSIRNRDIHLSTGTTIPVPLNWRSTFTIMIGTEYKWLRPRLLPDWEVALRGGYWFSETPIPDRTFDPAIPDSDNHSISVGLGLLCKGNGRFFGLFRCGGDGRFRPTAVGIDLAYQVLLYEVRTVSGSQPPLTLPGTVDGRYQTTYHIGQVNLRVNF